MVGQTPNFLRTNLKTVTIHKGNKPWGGGSFDILIHISDEGAKGKCGEEVMGLKENDLCSSGSLGSFKEIHNS